MFINKNKKNCYKTKDVIREEFPGQVSLFSLNFHNLNGLVANQNKRYTLKYLSLKNLDQYSQIKKIKTGTYQKKNYKITPCLHCFYTAK